MSLALKQKRETTWKKQGTPCFWQQLSRRMLEMSSCFKENKRSLHSHHQCHVLCHRAASLLGRPMCLNLEGSQALNCLWWIELMICLPPNQILQWCGLKGLYTTSKILRLIQFRVSMQHEIKTDHIYLPYTSWYSYFEWWE